MAVVLPIFLFVIFGIIEFGRAYMVKHVVASGARRGARLAVLDGSSNSQVEVACKSFCANTLGASANDITVAISNETTSGNDNLYNATAGEAYSVTISIPFNGSSGNLVAIWELV